ncbi:MAG: thymidylate synthase [Candidatus Wildermuthbacteria bacterium RIFCSPLOWO2_02_FULL_47_9c]|uniref:Thymidylate synthase n=2 Tax=Parcubacteria group TaxID=1794811 RepID=A0A1G2RSI3_9BACT|nr:MAG: thymidylate synthase [Candidatus Wildermuthbacteria bacterium GWA1_49_26]OHA66343.1 MAG: thymidylate synthase [Candidatus Wildermuthbacteria bacterium RIFCSPHIGHO2_01_FULL_50_47]OHA69992.1 MAG: thymidylate synthase [Candidatus Wildermuthbacteria bacterium RIFCSPHIGHO2_02_FULL_49_17]OHA72585.1 MAG: thymidylate synthase [Candidatus Wildermuthbacteria bacterium RIFCSPHIGHO2_12_FULL_49_13]OHA74429.1 MAG: thymidylate synthase [Candidatus Wildermuthbacteria bacterium RIFCSPLOWO2_01_FULL_50_46
MMHPEYQYLNLLKDIMEKGAIKHEFNTGIEEKSLFGRQIRFDLSQGFPLLTTKKVFTRGIIHELLWFLKGDSNIKYLVDNDVHIWDEWAYRIFRDAQNGKWYRKERPLTEEELAIKDQDTFIQKIKDSEEFAREWGDILTVYGRMWRKWPGADGREIDQIAWVIEKIKKTPDRRHAVVSAWNPDFIYEMASPGNARPVPPFCHTMFQFNVLDGKLYLQLYQRSADMFLGVPFNIASYALLLSMTAQVTGYPVGEFIHTFGDAHIYSNHYEQVREQVAREPRPFPVLRLNPEIKNIDNFTFGDIQIEGYDPWPPIKGEITVVGGF